MVKYYLICTNLCHTALTLFNDTYVWDNFGEKMPELFWDAATFSSLNDAVLAARGRESTYILLEVDCEKYTTKLFRLEDGVPVELV